VLVVALLTAQLVPRVVGPWGLGTARANAQAVVAWERGMGIRTEPALVAWLDARPVPRAVADVAYVGLHVPVLAGVLAWLFLLRPACFAWARGLFSVTLASSRRATPHGRRPRRGRSPAPGRCSATPCAPAPTDL
jgi:hypothetical protein